MQQSTKKKNKKKVCIDTYLKLRKTSADRREEEKNKREEKTVQKTE